MPDKIGDRRGEMLGVNIAMTVISLLALALRFWARATATKMRFWWDDWTALAAAVSIVTDGILRSSGNKTNSHSSLL